MLKLPHLETLREGKNLLAFSAGVDSTALFFLLLKSNVTFDIAIVNYNIREQSQEEVAYAKSLAKKHKIQVHVLEAPTIKKNFEANARKIRYDFFQSLIEKHSYTALLTAHHLGDRLEWMLMQLCKGAGCLELAGMRGIESREAYKLIRPLLSYDKEELIHYLKEKKIKYFEDATNADENITRNSFRHKFANPLLEEYKKGIQKSFAYLDEDRDTLAKKKTIHKIEELLYFQSSHARENIFNIDLCLKQNAHLMSANEKELLKANVTTIIGRKFVVSQHEKYTFILPYEEKQAVMSKEFKEECRKLKLDPKIRSYLYKNMQVFAKVKELLS